MTDDLLYHVDGELVPAEAATVRVDDRGFRFGDAAFETLRAYGGTIFEWEAHADRLDGTCEAMGMDHGLARADLRDRIAETLAANDLADAYVRLSITRGVQPGKLTPQPAVDPTVVVIVAPLPRGGLRGEAVWDGPATVRTVDTRRIPDAAIPARAKTHNYLNGILARIELRDDEPDENGDGDDAGGDSDAVGAGPEDESTARPDEALLLDVDGSVAEGATSNVFFVVDGALHTPSTAGPVLPGITRSVVLELAEQAGIPVHEGRYGPDAIREADEVFLTNTTWEVRPVERVDGRPVERVGGDQFERVDGPAERADGRSGDDADASERIEADGRSVTERLARSFDRRVEETCYDGR